MSKRRLLLIAILAGACGWPAGHDMVGRKALAVDYMSPVDPINDAASAGEDGASRPPSADAMRPTRNGFRLTPGMMRLGARQWLREGPFADVDFDEAQQKELSQRFAQRVMDAANKYGEQGRDFIETFLECTFARDRYMTPEMKQRFGEVGSDLVPAMRDLIRDFARDARPLLSDSQWEVFKESLKREFRNVDRAEKNLRRWAEGGAADDEGLDALDFDGTADDSGLGPGDQPRSTRALRAARRRAESEVRELGVNSWRDFLANTRSFLKFDAAQSAKGEELLAEYRHRSGPIMTPQWRQRVLDNRVKYNLRGVLKADLRPWLFHLEREYNELVAPLAELGNEFRGRVIALAMPDQRRSAINEVRERAAEHGLVFGDLDEALLRLECQE